MDIDSVTDGEPSSMQGKLHESNPSEVDRKDVDTPYSIVKPSEEHAVVSSIPKDVGTKGEVNMEANITTDDVIRAGGFGATDDISSFLPVAMDCTDFECSLRDARDFEEPQKEISRPGLGYAEST